MDPRPMLRGQNIPLQGVKPDLLHGGGGHIFSDICCSDKLLRNHLDIKCDFVLTTAALVFKPQSWFLWLKA